MKGIEFKGIDFEVKDLSREQRTAVIAHSAYNNIDRYGDIARKGMFNKSWQENKGDIGFYLNHNPEMVPGKPVDFWEDNQFAYTKAYLGTHTLGEDTLKMMDEGIIKKASFGYVTMQKNYIESNGKKARELKEVKHIETSVLTVLQANPLATVVQVNKSFDIENMLIELKASIDVMEKFCRNTTATDDCIKGVLVELEEAKNIIAKYDTASTHVADEPDASRKDDELYRRLLILNTQI